MGRKRDEVRNEIWGRDSEGGSVRQPRQPGTQSERRVTVHGVATRSLRRQSIFGLIFDPGNITFGKYHKDRTNAGKIFGCDLSFSNYIVGSIRVVFVLRCVTIRPVLTLNDHRKDNDWWRSSGLSEKLKTLLSSETRQLRR